ncbi:MAG TPA: beta-N-acetylhexosaminidase [Clostridia bacterium]|nr:beta-N-acetylhexosaminidase [Clostridia bacterium]
MPKDIPSQIGQLLTFGFDGTEVSAKLRATLATMQPGGVILFSRNIESPAQTHALLRECQKSVATPMLLCVDMEGGTVDRLKDVIAPAPSVADVFATGDKRLFRKHGQLIGKEVHLLGFNVDFAPVVDLGFEASKTVMTSRTASPNATDTVAYARGFLKGLKDEHVLGCGKHFPGLGEANLDTHHKLPSIEKSWKKLWDEDLVPYRTMRRELPFVMVAHGAYPAVTKDSTPASISKKWIAEILRKKIGYKGLVISDDLEMGGVLAAASIENAAVETIRAGADIFLVCRNDEHVWRTYNAVLREAERDKRFARLVETAAKRVLTFKKKSAELKHRPVSVPTQAMVDKLRRLNWEFTERVRLASMTAMAGSV